MSAIQEHRKKMIQKYTKTLSTSNDAGDIYVALTGIKIASQAMLAHMTEEEYEMAPLPYCSSCGAKNIPFRFTMSISKKHICETCKGLLA